VIKTKRKLEYAKDAKKKSGEGMGPNRCKRNNKGVHGGHRSIEHRQSRTPGPEKNRQKDAHV